MTEQQLLPGLATLGKTSRRMQLYSELLIFQVHIFHGPILYDRGDRTSCTLLDTLPGKNYTYYHVFNFYVHFT